MTNYYSVENGELQLRNTSRAEIIWQGKPEGHEVIKAQSIPESADCVALLEWGDKIPNYANLWRYSAEHGTVWKAELPTLGSDVYTDFHLEETGLVAHSWSGYKILIDLSTGRILSLQFTK